MVFLALAKAGPGGPAAKSLVDYPKVLPEPDAWWFMFYYAVTFGGFSGLASSLGIYFNTQYHLDAVTAGYFTAACVLVGSFFRPIGGAGSHPFVGRLRLAVVLSCPGPAFHVVG